MTEKIRLPRAVEIVAATAEEHPAVARAVATGKDETTIAHVKEAAALGRSNKKTAGDQASPAKYAAALGPTSRLANLRRGRGLV